MAMGSETGLKLLLALNSLLRTARIYDDNNRQAEECVSNFVGVVSTGCAEGDGTIVLKISNGRFFVGEERILQSSDSAAVIQIMLEYFEKRQLAGLVFFPSAGEATHADILAFARILNQAKDLGESLEWLENEFLENNLLWVEPLGLVTEDEVPAEKSGVDAEIVEETVRGEHARKIYSYGLANLKEVARKLGSGKRAGINKSIRLVQNMVNILKDDEPILLGLTTLRIYDDYTYAHSVNVAILSLCIGKRIGLSRKALERLGLCGLFHDLGKVDIPPEILKKPGKLTSREQTIMRAHSLHSVRQIAMLRAPRSRKSQLILAPFEHHMKFDHSGYPKALNWDISLFGRIIAIADVFDAITSPRVYRSSSPSPDRALGFMVRKAGRDFDPILLKVFINMLGFYPPGTVVELDGNEIGLVINTPEKNHVSGLPLVQLLLPDGNDGYVKGGTINLAEKSPKTGEYLRKIVNTAHPAAYDIQPAQFFF